VVARFRRAERSAVLPIRGPVSTEQAAAPHPFAVEQHRDLGKVVLSHGIIDHTVSSPISLSTTMAV